MSQLLIAIAARTPLAVLIDDLHWADADAVALFRNVGRNAPTARMLLVGAYRDEEAEAEGFLAQAISLLRRERGFERVALTGLAADDVETLLREAAEWRTTAWSAGPVDAILTKTFTDETKGNPFFVHSLLLHLEDEGRLRLEEGCWRATTQIEDVALPDGVRQLLQRRIGRLAADTQQLLAVGAAMGAVFRFDVLAALGDLEERRALAAIDEALAAELINAVDGLDGYAFVHALVRQTLYGSLNPSRRVRLHRRIAETMERIPKVNAPRPAQSERTPRTRSRRVQAGDQRSHSIEMPEYGQ